MITTQMRFTFIKCNPFRQTTLTYYEIETVMTLTNTNTLLFPGSALM